MVALLLSQADGVLFAAQHTYKRAYRKRQLMAGDAAY